MGAVDGHQTNQVDNSPADYFDDDRPRYHIQPPAGWMNDPNGPVFYRGRYHMFYQYLPEACEWDFGIVWGHVVSTDLVRWEHLPPALVPTPGWVDADGCFSGCCVMDSSGRPVILYTGVRLRSNAAAGPLPPPEHDLGMVWIESQCIAIPEDPDDDLLIKWTKSEKPFLPLPPADMDLTGWRDPFVLCYTIGSNAITSGSSSNVFGRQRPDSIRNLLATTAKSDEQQSQTPDSDSATQYRMLIGAGIKGAGGTALVYRSSSLTQGWELEGELCRGSSVDTGVVWECPLLVPLTPLAQDQTSPHPSLPPPWLISRKGIAATSSVPWAVQQQQQQQQQHPQHQAADGIGTDDHFRHFAAAGTEPQQSSFQAFSKSEEPAVEPSMDFQFSDVADIDMDRQPSAHLWLPRTDSRTGGPPAAPSERSSTVTASGGAPTATAAGASMASNLSHAKRLSGPVTQQELANLAAELERATTLESWMGARSNSIGSVSTSSGAGGGASRSAATRDGDVTIGSSILENSVKEAEGDVQGDDDDDDGIKDSMEDGSRVSSRFGLQSDGIDGSVVNEGDPAAHSEEEDKFAVAHMRVRSVATTAAGARRDGGKPASPPPTASHFAGAYPGTDNHGDAGQNISGGARQWYFFTVSPDAPTNPVLYWTGHVSGEERQQDKALASPSSSIKAAVRFEMDDAKGPYRLDLGDILYAPNVCQDDQGRWLLWGWLQERRKVGTYNYAGCLTVPRALHCTDDGRLIQAPVPELAELRQSKPFVARSVTLYPDAIVPIRQVRGERLDIECTIERGSALAAGLLFHSNEAEAEGSTAIVYDWDRNQLEAIFNVPSNWQPSLAGAGVVGTATSDGDVFSDVFDGVMDGVFDPAAALCTPRYGLSQSTSLANLGGVGGFGGGGLLSSSTTHLAAPTGTSPSGVTSRRTSLDDDDDDGIMSRTSASTTAYSGVDEPGMGVAIPRGMACQDSPHLRRAGSSLSLCLQRTNSFSTSLATSGIPRTMGALGTSMHLPPSRTASFIGTPRLGSSYAALGGLAGISDGGGGGGDGEGGVQEPEEDLAHLLEDLAAPMRTAEEQQAPAAEPRRVGGGLRMNPNDKLHLRIIVDHSCIEVFTGTGEVLSTRIYRGRRGSDGDEAGIDFVAFGGAALLERVEAYEVGSSWAMKEATPRAADVVVAGERESEIATPSRQQFHPSLGRTSSSAKLMSPTGLAKSPLARKSPLAPTLSYADELFDEILMGLEPSSTAGQPIVAQ